MLARNDSYRRLFARSFLNLDFQTLLIGYYVALSITTRDVSAVRIFELYIALHGSARCESSALQLFAIARLQGTKAIITFSQK